MWYTYELNVVTSDGTSYRTRDYVLDRLININIWLAYEKNHFDIFLS